MVTTEDVPSYVTALGEAMREVGATRCVLAHGPVRELVLAPRVDAVLDDAPTTAEQVAARAEAMLYASATGLWRPRRRRGGGSPTSKTCPRASPAWCVKSTSAADSGR